MTRLHRHRRAIAMLAVWALSIWLANHSGLALVIRSNGEKSCVDMLSLYFGFDHTVPALSTLSLVALLLSFALPIAGLIGLVLRRWRQAQRAQQGQA